MDIEFDEAEIQKRIRERKAQKAGIPLEAEALDKSEGLPENYVKQHYLTHKLDVLIGLRLNTWLPGPMGAGKSKAIELAAERNGLRFFCPPIGRETMKSDLLGYFNAQGNYVRTPFREAVENGGLVHFEEFDFASAAVGTVTNAALANDTIGFPDGNVAKHKDFVVLASANTYGTGANAKYIGSNGLNAATLDRFVFLEWGYDEKLERAISCNKKWTAHVQTIRAKVEKLGITHGVSPRASIYGGKLIDSKAFAWGEVEKMVLFKGLDAMTIQKINAQTI